MMLISLLLGVGWGTAVPILSHWLPPRLGKTASARPQPHWLPAAIIGMGGALGALVGWRETAVSPLLLTHLFLAFLSLIALIDLRYRLVPNTLIYPALLLTIIFHIWLAPLPGVLVATGGALAFGTFFLTFWLRPGDLGGGDVKLAALLGLAFGFPQVLWALLVAGLAGGLTAVYLLTSRRQTAKTHIPYAPFLCLGALIALLYTPHLFLW